MTVEEEESDGEEFIYAGSNKNPKMYYFIFQLGIYFFYCISDLNINNYFH